MSRERKDMTRNLPVQESALHRHHPHVLALLRTLVVIAKHEMLVKPNMHTLLARINTLVQKVPGRQLFLQSPENNKRAETTHTSNKQRRDE
jgi:hypothetical protein